MKFGCEWENEEHWMVDLVVRNLAAMAKAAGAEPGDIATRPDGDHVFWAGKVKLPMDPSCWDAASYAPLLAVWKPEPGEASDAESVLDQLLAPTVENLQQANRTVTESLAARPGDAAAHERAAFLLGVLGVRENARCFSDVRPLLCRMTAHLAFASRLRGTAEPSADGAWARVLHDLHAGRPKEALRRLEALPDIGGAGRWKRTVKLLVTGDWRRGEDLPDSSLVEAIAQARALHTHRGNPSMLGFLDGQTDLQETAEWTRNLAGPGRSVEEGHLAMSSAVPMELLEIGAVFPMGEEPSPADLAERFTGEAGDFTGAEVIADADWAAYFRRHVFAAAADVARFAIRQWAEPRAAAEWERTVLPYCKALKGEELVAPLLAVRETTYQKRLEAVRAAILEAPQRVPTALWYDLRFPVLRCDVRTSMPDQVPWFRTVSPPGTAHDPLHRIRFTGIHGSEWPGNVAALHKIDPWNPELCYELTDKTATDAASAKAIWGDLVEYSVLPMKQLLLLPSIGPEERIDILRKHAAIDPNKATDLGAELAIARRDDEAIAAYENAYENATDRVSFSNNSQWMIHHYKSKGEDEKAHEIADHNAEVYSARGLQSAMTLAIVEKKNAAAAAHARNIDVRYRDPLMPLIARWARGGDNKAADLLFPAGEKTVTLEELETAGERSGLRIDGKSPIVRLNGLHKGEVILAVDGVKVDTFDQYLALMCRDLNPEVTFLVRRGKKFREARCYLPDRRLEVQLSPAR